MGKDKFIGLLIDERYRIDHKIDSGNVGSVYYAEDETIQDIKAIKFIPKEKIERNKNWKQEIIKVNQLRYQQGVVKFHKYDEMTTEEGETYIYIIWDYVPGRSLRKLIKNKEITIQLLINVIERALEVFYACSHLFQMREKYGLQILGMEHFQMKFHQWMTIRDLQELFNRHWK